MDNIRRILEDLWETAKTDYKKEQVDIPIALKKIEEIMKEGGFLNLKEPVTAKKSANYLAVIEDAEGITHFWLSNGKYDGYCREVKASKTNGTDGTFERKKSFKEKLKELINEYSMESLSDTPDFILAEYLLHCLHSYGKAVSKRDAWFSFDADKNTTSQTGKANSDDV